MNRNNYNIISTILLITMAIFSSIGIVETITKFSGQSTFDLLVIQDENIVPKTNHYVPDKPEELLESIAELAAEIIQCCASGLSVALGNSTAVSGSTIDKNGIKIATLRGSWAHATHFTAYRTVKGTEYIGWVNSHGLRYQSSDEAEPADMCWMSRDLVERFVATATGYGSPYVVFPEYVTKLDTSIYNNLTVPFPENWRT